MGNKTKIEWTDATAMVDRAGSRVRYYARKDPTRPGQQLRRIKLKERLRWCRGCKAWLAAELVRREGACRSCINAEERARFQRDEAFRKRRRDRRDKRRVGRMPGLARELLTELFDGECAYCPAPAAGWDHFDPVTRGGLTTPGNMLPACGSCNSRKRNKDPVRWLESLPFVKPFTAEYLCAVAGAI